MRIKDPGHVYELDQRNTDEKQTFRFPDMEVNPNIPGTTTQEVLRMLIDRTKYCNSCLPWSGNEYIIHHLRMALVLHEARALIRKVEKGELKPENVIIGEDGHFEFWRRYSPEKINPSTDTGGPNPGVVCRDQRKNPIPNYISDQKGTIEPAPLPKFHLTGLCCWCENGMVTLDIGYIRKYSLCVCRCHHEKEVNPINWEGNKNV